MHKVLKSSLLGLLLAACTLTQAAPVQVAGYNPDTSNAVGVGASTEVDGPLTVTTSSFAGPLTHVEWWGYDRLLAGDGISFVVSLDRLADADPATTLVGTISAFDEGSINGVGNDDGLVFTLWRYVLTLDSQLSWAASPAALSIGNTDPDSEWYWQTDGRIEVQQAYFIYAEPSTGIPEPASLALGLSALLAAAGLRRRSSR